MKVKLWSIQSIEKLDNLKSEGKIVSIENKYSPEWDKEYLWMKHQMTIKIGPPKLKIQYPIWAWNQHENSMKKKPDLRRSNHLPPTTKGIRIEFEKNINEVLLSDFILWHFPLSYKSLIADNEAKSNEFDGRLKHLNLEKTPFENLPKKIKNEIEISWQRIFDLDFEDDYYTTEKNEKMIQACLWEIIDHEVLKIDTFIAR